MTTSTNPAVAPITARTLLVWVEATIAREKAKRVEQGKAAGAAGKPKFFGEGRVERVAKLTRECITRFAPLRKATDAEWRAISAEARFQCMSGVTNDVPDLDAPISPDALARMLYNTANYSNTAGNLG